MAAETVDLGECLLAALLPRGGCSFALEGMGLKFAAAVPAKFWVGKMLETPRFDACTTVGLMRGIQAWRELSAARGLVYLGAMNRHNGLARRYTVAELDATWLRLRRAYLDVWFEAGGSRGNLERRLDALAVSRRRAWVRHAGVAE